MRLAGYLDWSADWPKIGCWMILSGSHILPESDTAFFGAIT